MKLNNKGMTAIEMLVSFVIIVAITVGLYDTVLNYQNKQQIESFYSEVIAYTNSLQKVLQDELIKEHVTSVTVNDTDGYRATFYYSTGTSKQLLFVPMTSNSVGNVRYGGFNYPPPQMADFGLGEESKIEVFSDFVKITLVFHHPNFTDGIYAIKITAPLNYPVS